MTANLTTSFEQTAQPGFLPPQARIKSWPRRTLGSLYWKTRTAIEQSAPARALHAATNPLWVARLCLHQVVAQHAHHATGWMLDLGCGSKPYQRLFPQVTRYIGTDLPGARAADLNSNALALPFRDQSFDAILCNQVLEHVPEPKQLFIEVVRVLKPGGVLILTTPQTWGLHLEPHDFYRFTKYGLQYLAQSTGLEVLHVAPTSGLPATTAQRIADAIAHGWAAKHAPWLFFPLCALLAPILVAGYCLDLLLGKHGDTLDNVLIARKPDA